MKHVTYAIIALSVVAAIASLINLANVKHASVGIPLESAQKLCQWPKHPGEAMFVHMNESGRYECWELNR